jgi:2-hydroxy-3-oxopropionate reductase
MKVGFIGLGAMGLPMAKRVIGSGHKLYTTFHRRREPAEDLRAMGAELLGTPAEVARAADVIITILPADAELKEAFFGVAGILSGFSEGKVLVEMTTGTGPAMQEIEV